MLAAALDASFPAPTRKRRRADRPPPPGGDDPAGVDLALWSALPPMTELRRWGFELYGRGKLSAKALCTCAWACRAHPDLGVADLAMDPDRHSGGNFEMQVRRAMKTDEFVKNEVYFADIPFFGKKAGSRVFEKHPFLLPHERVYMMHKAGLRFGAADAELLGLPRFRESEVIVTWGALSVVLMRIYLDAAVFAKASAGDSFYGFYWSDISTGERFLITVVRKKSCCRTCGCGGRCTVEAVMRVILYSSIALKARRNPALRHDDTPLDPVRQARANEPLPYAGDFVEVGADMGEFWSSFGFKQWNSDAPCFSCDCTPANMHAYSSAQEGRPYNPRTDESLRDDLGRNVIRINASFHEACQIQAAMKSDHVEAKGRGLSHVVGVLHRGDRLLIGGDVQDECQDLRTLAPYCREPQEAADILFFRRLRGSPLTTVCPLYNAAKYSDNVYDLMHVGDLGVFQYDGGLGISILLKHDCYHTGETNADVRHQRGLYAMQMRLFDWYDVEGRPFKTRVNTLTLNLVMGQDGVERPCVSAKAMESRGLLYFTRDELARHQEYLCGLGAGVAQECNNALRALKLSCEFVDILRAHGRTIPTHAFQRCVDIVVAHNSVFRAAGGKLAPKHHYWFEMVLAIPTRGNPLFYTTYPDETLNGMFANISRAVHPKAFAISVLLHYRALRYAEGKRL